MEIEFDPAKNKFNIEQRGVSFEQVINFEFESALVHLDQRKDYGEPRFNALGMIGNRLHHLTYTMRDNIVRIISLRKANLREVQYYVKQS